MKLDSTKLYKGDVALTTSIVDSKIRILRWGRGGRCVGGRGGEGVFAFPPRRYVLSMFFNFGRFSTSNMFLKKVLIKKEL